jgi:hypothetical protein
MKRKRSIDIGCDGKLRENAVEILTTTNKDCNGNETRQHAQRTEHGWTRPNRQRFVSTILRHTVCAETLLAPHSATRFVKRTVMPIKLGALHHNRWWERVAVLNESQTSKTLSIR